MDTSQLGHNLVNTIFDAVSFNAAELGRELSGSGLRRPASLEPRGLASEDELPETIHIEVPRQIIDGLLNLTGGVAQGPAAAVTQGLNDLLGAPVSSQPAETRQSQASATRTPQAQSPTSTPQQQQNPPPNPRPSRDPSNVPSPSTPSPSTTTSTTTSSSTAAPTETPPRAALGAGVADQNNAALFRVAQTLFDGVKEVVKANADIVGNGAADVITGQLSTAETYSLHVVDLCRGEFESKSGSPRLTTTFCDGKPASTSRFLHLTSAPFFIDLLLLGRLDPVKSLVRKPLVLGPVTVDLEKTSLPEAIDSLVDAGNGLLLGIFLLYLGSMLLTLLAMATTLGSLKFPISQVVIIVNLGVTAAATALSFLSSLATTIVTVTLVPYLNKVGLSVGFSAARGNKFIVLTWATTAMLIVGTGFWIGLLAFIRVSSALRRKQLWEHTKVEW